MMGPTVTPQTIDGTMALLKVIADPKQATIIMQQIAEAQAELAKRQANFKLEKQAVAAEVASLLPQRDALAASKAELATAQEAHEAKVKAHESEWQTRTGALSDRKRDLDKRETEMNARQRQHDQQAAALREREEVAHALHKEALERLDAVAVSEAALAEKHAQLKALVAG